MATTIMPVLRAYDGSEYYYMTNLTLREAGKLLQERREPDLDPRVLTIEVSGERPEFIPVELDTPFTEYVEDRDELGYMQLSSETTLTVVGGAALLDVVDRSDDERPHSVPALLVRKGGKPPGKEE